MKLQSVVATMMTMLATIASGCSVSPSPGGGTGGSGGTTSSGGSGGTTSSGGSSAGGSGSGGSSGADTCPKVTACGGELTGSWEVKSSCLKTSGTADIGYMGLACLTAQIKGSITVTGTFTVGADAKFTDKTVAKGSDTWELEAKCLDLSGTKVSCADISGTFAAMLSAYGYEDMKCVNAPSGGGCTCQGKVNATGGLGMLFNDMPATGKVRTADNTFSLGDSGLDYTYCVKGDELTVTPKHSSVDSTPFTGTVVLQKSGGGGSGGAGGGAGGTSSQGGSAGKTTEGGTGGKTTGPGGSGGAMGGSSGGGRGGSTAKGGATGANTGGTAGGTGGSTSGGFPEGPCDLYQAANMPCAAAYSMVRALSKSYSGPLFQVRAGSSSNNNTMSGGTTKDIMPGPDGFVDSATVDAACSGYCTVSVLYDHSGNGNHLKRAPKGNTAGGASGALDDYESIATKGKVTAGGHTVYSLYMNKVEGYRSTEVGKNMPVGNKPQGTYELADGTRKASACCWDFGNVTTKPATEWHFMDTICLGHTYWGNSGDSNWFGFGADFEGGVWTGGSKVGDPGWGALDDSHPTNTKNPTMGSAKFALGFLRVNPSTYAIRVADVSKDNTLITAYNGNIPQGITVDHRGGIVLGVGGDNSNNSWGTFYEGAMVAGFPTDDLEESILKNIKAVGYAAAP